MKVEGYPHRWNMLEDWHEHVKFDGASRPDVGYVIRKKGFDQQIAIPYPPPYITACPIPYPLYSPQVPRYPFAGNIAERLTPTPRAYQIKYARPWSFPHTLFETTDRSVSLRVFVIDPEYNEPEISKLGVVRGYQNIDGDELWYVYRGNGVCTTELGTLLYEAGDYLYIPRGFSYELCADLKSKEHVDTDRTILIGIESRKQLLRPSSIVHDVPYRLSDMRIPIPRTTNTFPITQHECENPYVLAVKRSHVWSVVAYSGNLLAHIGYSGSVYPFIINEKDINVPVIDTLHTDPTLFTVFVTDDASVAVSVFRPRRVHSIPYHHDNIYDECMFLADDYIARDKSVAMGDMTFHPQGFCHGPQPSALSMSHVENHPEHNKWNCQRATMFESRTPLIPSRESLDIEIKNYWRSWIHGEINSVHTTEPV